MPVVTHLFRMPAVVFSLGWPGGDKSMDSHSAEKNKSPWFKVVEEDDILLMLISIYRPIPKNQAGGVTSSVNEVSNHME